MFTFVHHNAFLSKCGGTILDLLVSWCIVQWQELLNGVNVIYDFYLVIP